MKKYYFKIISLFLILFVFMYGYPVRADLPLQGKVIVVDSGHGGLDPGALYKDIYEKDITLAIGKYLEKSLNEMGATVIMTRDDDNDLSRELKIIEKKLILMKELKL